MTNRLFSLFEKHQKLDEALRLAEQRSRRNPFEIVRLIKLKQDIKARIAGLLHVPAAATVH